jgi:hypothetical protein
MTDADDCRKRTALKERRERQAEKSRLEAMAAKMSAKKLQRLRKVCKTHLSSLPIRTSPSRPVRPQVTTSGEMRCERNLTPRVAPGQVEEDQRVNDESLVLPSWSTCSQPHCCIACIEIPGNTSLELLFRYSTSTSRIASTRSTPNVNPIVFVSERPLRCHSYRKLRRTESGMRADWDSRDPISANFPRDGQRLSH